ncbi:dihydrofolate reductase family protein [Sedimenticola hydrogenitrophicus]|uniref:dihydrofolate reductase family protein n=1 Tax=Sedimenticola hydrogenitrophicus TaxID=2967975 RepID=UPI0021A31366|nr:dihydrofolate reductase family protein [Sedimenticola hydrogenitrophicus]
MVSGDDDQSGSDSQGDPGLQQLYPDRNSAKLAGLYLSQDLRTCLPDDPARCYVYSNFLSSLDGRIAVTDPETGESGVPEATANQRDWRLLLELAAPADALIMNGRYLRDLSEGRAQSLPPYSGQIPNELVTFRERLGLPGKPVIVFLSRSLDIPTAALERLEEREIIIATTEKAHRRDIRQLEARDVDVVSLGQGGVDGGRLMTFLAKRELRLVYSIAGPEIMHVLLAADVLQRLYLTTALRILAGNHYATIVHGPGFRTPVDFRLSALYLDSQGPDGVEQLLQVYDRMTPPDG